MNKFGRKEGGRDSGRFGRGGSSRFGRGSDRPKRRTELAMHEVTCDKCGSTCEVPFKPTEGKPVYCSDCFKKNDSSESRRSSRGRSERFRERPARRAETTMHEVTCDKCGNTCEVPFKPTEGKPVYCSDCFKKRDNSGHRGKPDQSGLEEINRKLDKIMEALEID